MKAYVKDFIAMSVLIVAVGIFLLPLFGPKPQLVVTPDFIRSDAWHSSFSTKYLLSLALKNGHVPLWSSKLGGGFPLLGEGQIGTFFVINTILYRFFDVVTAYNLSLLVALITIGFGVYAWFRSIGNMRLASLYGALAAELSGPAIVHLTHVALLQSFSLLPWVMYLTYKLAKSRSTRTFGLFVFVASQQFFAGSPQPAFITALFSSAYYFFLIRSDKTIVKRLFVFILAYAFVFGLSALQILPSQEFLKQTANPGGFETAQASQYQFPLKHLATFLQPFALGNPKNGNYYAQSNATESIFWENSGYIGILPIFLIGYLVVKKRRSLFHSASALFWGSVSVVTFLLMLGMNSPLYLVYSIWPMTLFHVASRFIWILVFVLIYISVKALSLILKSAKNNTAVKILVILCITAQTAYVINTWSTYHLYVDADLWLQKPLFAKSAYSNGSIYTIASSWMYNTQFIKGWKDSKPYYFLENSLSPNSAPLWNFSNFDVVSGRPIWRQTIADSLLTGEIQIDTKEATVSAMGMKLFNLDNIRTLISPVKISTAGLTLLSKIQDTGGLTLYEYQNNTAVGTAYLASSMLRATTAEDAKTQIGRDVFVPGQTVLLEKNTIITGSDKAKGVVTIVRDSDAGMSLAVTDNPVDTYLVVTRSYYPGWQATVDGKSVPILPANVNQEAIPVTHGDHHVQLTYNPGSVKTGALVTGIFLIVVLCLIAFPL